MFGLLTQWGLRGSLTTLRKPDALERCLSAGCRRCGSSPFARCSRSSRTSTADHHYRARATSDRAHRSRARLLATIPGSGSCLRSRSLPRSATSHDSQRPQADRLCRAGADDQTIRAELLDRTDLQGRFPGTALGCGRGRPARLAANQPLAPALHPNQDPARQGQPRQERRRPQGPDRVLARPRPPTGVQASRTSFPPVCPGKLHGDLAA